MTTRFAMFLMLLVALGAAWLPAAAAPNSVVDALAAGGSASVFQHALTATGLNSALDEGGPYTLFVPSDQAFAGVSSRGIDALFANRSMLTGLVRNHVVSGRMYGLADLHAIKQLVSLDGQPLNVTVQGNDVWINDARIIGGVTGASNGALFVLDGVLYPRGFRIPAQGAGVASATTDGALAPYAIVSGRGTWTWPAGKPPAEPYTADPLANMVAPYQFLSANGALEWAAGKGLASPQTGDANTGAGPANPLGIVNVYTGLPTGDELSRSAPFMPPLSGSRGLASPVQSSRETLPPWMISQSDIAVPADQAGVPSFMNGPLSDGMTGPGQAVTADPSIDITLYMGAPYDYLAGRQASDWDAGPVLPGKGLASPPAADASWLSSVPYSYIHGHESAWDLDSGLAAGLQPSVSGALTGRGLASPVQEMGRGSTPSFMAQPSIAGPGPVDRGLAAPDSPSSRQQPGFLPRSEALRVHPPAAGEGVIGM